MTRSRLTLAFIENKSRRKACYKKRKRGLTKKVEELTTLCGVQACVIIYSHFDAEPQIWPTEHAALMEILIKFRNLSALEQNRKMMTQESFTRQRTRKLQDQCKKLRQVNRQKEIKLFVSDCLAGETQRTFTLADLNEMRWSIYFAIQTISRQIEIVKGQSPPPAPAPTVLLMPSINIGGLMIPTIQTAGFANGYNPVVPPDVHLVYPQNPLMGMNVMVQNAQPAVVPPGMSLNSSENPAWVMNMVMQNEQVAGFANGYSAPVATGMPTNNFQNPTMVQNEQQYAGFANDYHPVFAPEMPVDPRNPSGSMNSMVPNEQSTGFANGYVNAVLAAQMVVNDPQNPTSGMNAAVPPEQSAGSSDFDWISYLFNDKGAGTGSTDP